jgi:hypothetical protein
MAPPQLRSNKSPGRTPERIRRSALKTRNRSTGVTLHLNPGIKHIPEFKCRATFVSAKSLAGELSSEAPGVLLQKSEYAKIVLQHRHLPSENGHVDVVEFTDPGLRRRLGCEGFVAGLGHDSVSVAERRASACQQALLMEITLERTSFSCEERSKLGQDI